MKLPPYGLCLPCQVARVKDGDSMTVTITGGLEWDIRLIGCNCPGVTMREAKTEEEKKRGIEAAVFAKRVLDEEADSLSVFVPLDMFDQTGPIRMLRSLSFERIPAHLFVGTEDTLADILIRAGHAERAN